MPKEMLINVSAGEECRIAVVENNRLQELYMERTSATSHVGNIYKGKVTNVEPSIQAAFIDFGIGRNGFLHISDLMPTYFGKGRDYVEKVGQKLGRRDRPPIQQCLRRGDEIIVQIIKEGIGTKGPTLTTYLSVPGRVLVMMPGMQKMGVSKKIEDEVERKRLRTILDGLKPPKDCGFIIRTAGVGKTKVEIERDLKYLARLWETVKKVEKKAKGPTELYTEGDLVTRTVRDVFTSDVERIICDDQDIAKKVKDFVKLSMPRTKNKVELYDEHVPLFHKYGIEKEIELMYSRHVPLPSGGSLVIDSTEAVVAIDVNSGKFREHNDAEMTAFKTDMEAAEEIPRQLKLRDLGGVIICDFIDLRFERHRKELEQKLYDSLKNDRAKTRMLRMSQFGIVEMTRQRMRPSLKRSIYHDCPACKGAGLVKTAESMSLDAMRQLSVAAADERVVRITLTVGTETASNLLNKKRTELAALEEALGKKIVVLADPALAIDELKLELFDLRDGLVFVEALGMSPQAHGALVAAGRQSRSESRNGRPNAQNRKGGRSSEDEPLDADDLRGDDSSEEESGPPVKDLRNKNRQRAEAPAADGADAEMGADAAPQVKDLRHRNRKIVAKPVESDGDEAGDEAGEEMGEETGEEESAPVAKKGGRKPAAASKANESARHQQAERELAKAEEEEESANEDVSDVIDVDDTDAAAPLDAPDAFFDPNSREHRERREFTNRRQNGQQNRDNRPRQGGQQNRNDNRQGGQGNRDNQRDNRNPQGRNDNRNQQQGRNNQNRPPVAKGPDLRVPRDEDNRGNRVPPVKDLRAPRPAPIEDEDDNVGNSIHDVPSRPANQRGQQRGKQRGQQRGPKPAVIDLRNPARRPAPLPPAKADLNGDMPPDEPGGEFELPGPGNEAGRPEAPDAGDTADGQRKRRRRRRGGRGRRRGNREEGENGAENEAGQPNGDGESSAAVPQVGRSVSPTEDPEADVESDFVDPVVEAAKESAPPVEDDPKARFAKPITPRAPRRSAASSTRVPPVPAPVPVVKTGSTDKHLVDDEPVNHEPTSRPSSRMDLDELPEFDED